MLEEDIVERAMLRDMAAWQKQCADEATQTAVETDNNVPNRAPERRQFKWESCPAYGRACAPRCYNSGRNVGEVFLVCNGWRRMSQSGQRTCWGRKRFDMSLFQTLPVVIKEKYHSLRLSLQRNRRRWWRKDRRSSAAVCSRKEQLRVERGQN